MAEAIGFCPQGRVEEFNPTKGDWTSYAEKLEQYFLANGIKGVRDGSEEGLTNTRKVAIFLTLTGPRTYSLLRDLVDQTKPAEKSYKVLVDSLAAHFTPKPLMIAERFKFQQRTQRADESVTEYMAQLRRMTEHCKFEDQLDDTLRDRFVSGINSQCNHSEKVVIAR